MIRTELRNATLQDLVSLLRLQQDIKYDIVASSDSLFYSPDANLLVDGGDVDISDEGVSLKVATLTPTSIFEDHISQKLGIPRRYINRMRQMDEGALLANNVNTWLHRAENVDKNWFVRGFMANGEGIARAFLSDRYQVIDNIDTLTAALDGIRKADTPTEIGKCNLTERSMYVEIEAPAVRQAAPILLENYRSPFTGMRGIDNPIVFAGFVLTNSETGGAAFTITPRLIVEVCRNGMQMKVDAMRRVHLGSQMEQGEIAWSDETRFHYTELIKNQVTDAIHTFLSPSYLERTVSRIENEGNVPLSHPRRAVENVAKELRYSEEEADAIFDFFIQSGDTRAIGVTQAITAYAQVVDDADRANELEGDAMRALELAVRYR